MRKIKCSEVVQDLTFYPRCTIDWGHVDSMVASLDAGGELPPIVVCSKTLKAVDGFHRLNATLRKLGPDGDIEVVEKDYRSPKEMWLDAIRLNAKHGLPFNRSDKSHCLLTCRKFGCDDSDVAAAIGVSTSSLGRLAVATNTMSLSTTNVLRKPAKESSGREIIAAAEARPATHDCDATPSGRIQIETIGGSLALAERSVIDACVVWFFADSDEEMDAAIGLLTKAVEQYLSVKDGKGAA